MQQLLADREERVREMVIRSISLIVAICDDTNKYRQIEELALNTLDDSSDIVVGTSIQILFPVLAKWALDIGKTSFFNSSFVLIAVLIFFVVACKNYFNLRMKSDFL